MLFPREYTYVECEQPWGPHPFATAMLSDQCPLYLPASAAMGVGSRFLLKAEHCSTAWTIYVVSQLTHPWMLGNFTRGYHGVSHCLLAPVVGI